MDTPQASDLLNLSDSEFETTFLRQMIMHHMMALVMARPLSERAVNEPLRRVAGEIVRSQSAEIAQMQQWLSLWQRIL